MQAEQKETPRQTHPVMTSSKLQPELQFLIRNTGLLTHNPGKSESRKYLLATIKEKQQ
jgi:hypothetical protein